LAALAEAGDNFAWICRVCAFEHVTTACKPLTADEIHWILCFVRTDCWQVGPFTAL